eukprot:jgi/Mesvir1/21533/Mv03974-RA.1
MPRLPARSQQVYLLDDDDSGEQGYGSNVTDGSYERQYHAQLAMEPVHRGGYPALRGGGANALDPVRARQQTADALESMWDWCTGESITKWRDQQRDGGHPAGSVKELIAMYRDGRNDLIDRQLLALWLHLLAYILILFFCLPIF